MATIYTNIEVDLENFSDEDIKEEFLYRNLLKTISINDFDIDSLVKELEFRGYEVFKNSPVYNLWLDYMSLGVNFDNALKKFFWDTLDK